MDAIIMNNTRKYAKYSVLKQVENPRNRNDIDKAEIYFVKPKERNVLWRAVLVDGMTQSRKTWRCFQILKNKIDIEKVDNVLVLFVTQANNSTSVEQVIQRVKINQDLNTVIPPQKHLQE